MSFRNLVISVLFLSVFLLGLQFSVDTDTWWQMRTGELIAEERAVPTTDSFSYTRADEEWVYPSFAWLSEMKLYFIYDTFASVGLNIWVAAMVTLAFAFVYMAMSGPPLLRAFLVVLAVTASSIYWAARPYMVSFVLSAVFLWILEDFRWKRKNHLIWLLPLMVLWVNSHPGFAIGFLIVGIYAADEGLRWLWAIWRGPRKSAVELRARVGLYALIIVALLLAACLNPAGTRALTYPFETISIGPLQEHIEEWQSPNFHTLQAQPFAWLLLISLGIVGAAGAGLALSDFLLLAIFGYMGLMAARNIPLFSLGAAVVLSRQIAAGLPALLNKLGFRRRRIHKPAKWMAWANLIILVVLALAVVARAASVASEVANRAARAAQQPYGAVEYLKAERPLGRLFNSYNFGGYLIWWLREYPVYIDGRTDLYDDGLMLEWLDTVAARTGWQQTLDHWEVRLVLIEPSWPLASVLADHDEWTLLYQDDNSVLYGR